MIRQVLDHGYVQLIERWGSDERIIESARMSTSKGFEGWEKDFKLLKYLWKHKHMTPFEMGGITFEVKAPIMVFREWFTHRTQSRSEMSARYVPLPDENYRPSAADIVARSQAAATTKNRQAAGSGVVISLSTAQAWLEDLDKAYMYAQLAYETGIKHGVPKELARLPVPVGRYSKMRVSANLRNWLQFLTLRMPYTAQKEIRLYAEVVAMIAADLFPKTMTLFMEDLVTEDPGPKKGNGHYVGLDRTKG